MRRYGQTTAHVTVPGVDAGLKLTLQPAVVDVLSDWAADLGKQEMDGVPAQPVSQTKPSTTRSKRKR